MTFEIEEEENLFLKTDWSNQLRYGSPQAEGLSKWLDALGSNNPGRRSIAAYAGLYCKIESGDFWEVAIPSESDDVKHWALTTTAPYECLVWLGVAKTESFVAVISKEVRFCAVLPASQYQWLGWAGYSIDRSHSLWDRLLTEASEPKAWIAPRRSTWPIPSSEDRALFAQLVRQWRNETGFYSSLREICMHSSYQRIIGMGRVAVCLILQELKDRPDHWFWALQAITGEDPTNPSDAGRVRRMAEAWLNWGRKQRCV